MMKTWIAMTVTCCLLVSITPIASGQERTGENIKEIVGEMHTGVAGMESQLEQIQQDRQASAEHIDGLFDELGQTTDSNRAREIRAEIYNEMARQNDLDTQEVLRVMDTVSENLYPNMNSLAEELDHAGFMGMQSRAAFLEYRENIRPMIQAGAGIATMLDRIRHMSGDGEFSDEVAREAEELRSTLAFAYQALNQAGSEDRVSGEYIREMASAMGALHTRLKFVRRHLAQEKLNLKARTYEELVDVVGGYLEGHSLTRMENVSASTFDRVGHRSAMLSELRANQTSGTTSDRRRSHGDDRALMRRLSGHWDWD
jgi:hypothetical protein